MNSLLATDDANPEFVGARNPDSALNVRFYIRPSINKHQTREQGRPIYEDKVHIEISTPGNALNIIDRPMYESDKRRFPQQWSYFEMTQGKDEMEAGTPLSKWPLLQPSQVEMLRALKFRTVENVAMASDENIGRIGMLAGMAPYAFRDRAKQFLAVAKDSSILQKQEEALKASAAELEELKRRDAEREAQFQAMQKQMAELAANQKKTPGRKAKEQEAA
jgi:hypothetical protein